jgi:hypothetical protein
MSALLLVLSLVGIDPGSGTSGFEFLHITPTAREAAIAGATSARAESPMGFWYSPAHAGLNGYPQGQLGYLNYVGGIHIGTAGYSQTVAADKGIGVGVVYMNSGSMKRTDPLGNELGTFGVSYADLNVSGSWMLSDLLTLGVGVQGLYGAIDTFSTVGVAGNVGAAVRVPIEELNGLYAGVVARNLGYQVKAFQEGRDPMPVELGGGLSYAPTQSLNLNIDVLKPLDNRLVVRGGVEGWIGDMVALRAGYSTLGSDLTTGGGIDILAGVTTGLGIRYENYQLDYAFIPMVELGMAHRLSLVITL